MFAIICRGGLKIPRKDGVFVEAQSLPIVVKLFSSAVKSTSDDGGGDKIHSFAVSYLINSCGLSPNDAVSVSKKLCFKSPEKPDAVLRLLRNYGFTNAHIAKLVARWPAVLHSCPEKTLLPKLEFFRSFGVSDAVSAKTLSSCPMVLRRSLENHLIPLINYLRSVVQSDERVVRMFATAPRAFDRGHCCKRVISSNMAMLRERGVPESSIVSLLLRRPPLLMIGKEKFTAYVDRATEMGFDLKKIIFVNALEVFADLSESTLKRKMDAYRGCGWSESDVSTSFLKYPLCMKLSEDKLKTNVDFLVNEVGLKHDAITRSPVILGYSLDKTMRPRWLVIKVLSAKGLLHKPIKPMTLFSIGKEKFVQRYILVHPDHIPQLLDVYQGKLDSSARN